MRKSLPAKKHDFRTSGISEKSDLNGVYSSKKGVGFFLHPQEIYTSPSGSTLKLIRDHKLSVSAVARHLGVHRVDVSYILHGNGHKVGSHRRRMIRSYLIAHGFLPEPKRRRIPECPYAEKPCALALERQLKREAKRRACTCPICERGAHKIQNPKPHGNEK